MVALIGTNSAGKSAALQSMNRLFGISQADRTLQRSDFHLPKGKEWDEVEEATLSIEAVLDFPELISGTNFDDAAAACFKHMTIQGSGGPYCRIRLDGKWERSNLPDGEIEQRLCWITSPETASKEEKQSVLNHDRSRIHVHYVPATRDPVRHIRQVSGSLFHSLLQSVYWSDNAKNKVTTFSDEIRKAFSEEKGVALIEKVISECWQVLHVSKHYKDLKIRPVGKRLEDIIKQVEATFSPSPSGKEDNIDQLSDGQKSLFYLALVAATFKLQREANEDPEEAISIEKLDPPILNVFAVEEPENHVSPHYLGRIVRLLGEISKSERAQVVLTSHSPSILARIDPENVRYFRKDEDAQVTAVNAISLPEKESDQYKFIREAVRSFPELYFAKFVLLGEGASEEVVLPRIAEGFGLSIDTNFVSVVPLGGRHVNHLWKLLNQLRIPHLTLLDLDRERGGGGWGRVKYALEELLNLNIPQAQVLGTLSREQLAEMHTWDVKNVKSMDAWVTWLEKFGVYFSAPLDLDFMMLQAFSGAYHAVAADANGPRIPKDSAKFSAALSNAIDAVLKESATQGITYSESERLAFFWYRYLFLGRGKPSTHIAAMINVDENSIKTSTPQVLVRLVNKLKEAL
jgi:predicted ATP-dependent endonuclease of OLD family